MDEQRAFFRAISADWLNDTPRLAYADWLEENGDGERAEFIRLQCMVVNEDATIEQRHRADTRLVELSPRLIPRLQGQLPDLEPAEWGRYERGFPSLIRCKDWPTLNEVMSRLAGAVPIPPVIVREEENDTVEGTDAPVLTHPDCQEIHRLSYNVHFMVRNAVVPLPVLGQLHHVELTGQQAAVTWFRHARNHPSPIRSLRLNNVPNIRNNHDHLESCAHWKNLESLAVVASSFEPTIERLSYREIFTELRSLCLINYHLSHPGFSAKPVNWPNLRDLELRSVSLTDQGLIHLARNPMPHLKTLRLPKCELHAAAVKIWFDQQGPLELTRLNVSGNDFSEPGGTWPDTLRIRHLELDDTMLSSRSLQALFDWSGFAHVESLDISNNSIREKCVTLLCEQSKLNLRSLALRGNKLDHDHLKKLCDWPGLAQIESLELGGNGLPARAFQTILHCPHLGQLRRLRYDGNDFSDDMARRVLKEDRLMDLCEWSISGHLLSDESIDALRDRFGNRIRI